MSAQAYITSRQAAKPADVVVARYQRGLIMMPQRPANIDIPTDSTVRMHGALQERLDTIGKS